jgi:hypothetical protein
MLKMKPIYLFVTFLLLSECCLGQMDSIKYNIIRINLESEIVVRELMMYNDQVLKKLQNSLDEKKGVLELYIYEERDGKISYYIGFVMHNYEVTYRAPSFYTIIDNNVVLIHTTRINYLDKSNVDFDKLLSIISDKLYDYPTLSYHPPIWLIKTTNGNLSKKRVLEYFDFKDQ